MYKSQVVSVTFPAPVTRWRNKPNGQSTNPWIAQPKGMFPTPKGWRNKAPGESANPWLAAAERRVPQPRRGGGPPKTHYTATNIPNPRRSRRHPFSRLRRPVLPHLGYPRVRGLTRGFPATPFGGSFLTCWRRIRDLTTGSRTHPWLYSATPSGLERHRSSQSPINGTIRRQNVNSI